MDKLNKIINMSKDPIPWAEGETIPWNEPEFSERMLAEHLNQTHDAASRRSININSHVEWIHNYVLKGQPGRILDLGCGPGLYTSLLAKKGHICLGIDFSPASIAYAKESSSQEGLNCTYIEGDIRTTPFDEGHDLIMLIFGELNVFPPADAALIFKKAYAALRDGGVLLLEIHHLAAVERNGKQPRYWRSYEEGLFSPRPHLYLQENFWSSEHQVSTTRYFVIDAASAKVTSYTASQQGYDDLGYRQLIEGAGFGDIQIYPGLTGIKGDVSEKQGLYVWMAQKGSAQTH